MALAAQYSDTSTYRRAIESNGGAAEKNGNQMAMATQHPDAGTCGCASRSYAASAILRPTATRRHRAIPRRDATLEKITPRPTHQ